MRIRHLISSVAVALSVADRVVGRLSSEQTGKDVTTINKNDQVDAQVNASPEETTRDTIKYGSSSEYILDSVKTNEGGWISSSESQPAISTRNEDSIASRTTIFARQDEAEPIPTQNPNVLPIEPTITPAMGIAGAIMLGTGVALCLVGIKKSLLHIFLSTGYLASLAVTVLIVYVMNPQHSNAIQGAYMVAAVVTGLIFGAVSLVFQEVTEGLGCMLGSFCFAMWLLVLAPGGIIHSTAGRGILIGVITVVGFALSFSHHTRMYALLLCTSFAGATITMLGVDCFSRAGLKEFWLYLWSLNDKQFPLETKTYPITRGIRVEIACIIVVFLLGLVSQFKLWKVIKAHRDQAEEERKRAEDERLEAEAAIGRDVEANNERERADWEAVYGEKKTARVHVDSGVGSSVETFGKDQYSVREREVDPIELSEIAELQSGRSSSGENESGPREGRASVDAADTMMENGEKSARTSQDTSRTRPRGLSESEDAQENAVENDGQDQAYAPGAPEVVPLPFRVPTEDEPQEIADGTVIAREDAIENASAKGAAMPLQKMSLQRLNEMFASQAQERRDDQASSVAATADDIAVLDEISPEELTKRHSTAIQEVANDGLLVPARAGRDHSRPISMVSDREMEEAVEEEDDEALARAPVVLDETATPVVPQVSKRVSSAAESVRRLSDATKADKSHDGSEGRPGSVSEHLVEQLPPKLSKIALTYRTNEWAKHIADADHPENGEEVERPSSPGVQVDTNVPEEVARPVDVEALQQTSFVEEPALPAHTASKSSKKSHRKSQQSETRNSLNRSSSTQSATPVYAFGRSPSQVSLNRHDSTSASPAKAKHGSVRKSTMHLTNQTLVESPVEDAPETFQYHDFTPDAGAYANPQASASSSNLLDERNQMLQRRPTTISFNGFRSTPSLGMMSGAIPEDQVPQTEDHQAGFASPTQSSPTLPAHIASDENMTLSQRRSLMQSSGPQTMTPTHKPRPSIYSTMAYDSHQPARNPSTNSVQQSARLNQWRQTLQQDVQAKQPTQVVEKTARQNMMDERRQSEMREAMKKEEKGRRQSAIDEAMRRGQLDGAHRDAMRRMQAKANRDGA